MLHPVPKYRRHEAGLNRTLREALPGDWIEVGLNLRAPLVSAIFPPARIEKNGQGTQKIPVVSVSIRGFSQKLTGPENLVFRFGRGNSAEIGCPQSIRIQSAPSVYSEVLSGAETADCHPHGAQQ